jgi:hypothetical protein
VSAQRSTIPISMLFTDYALGKQLFGLEAHVVLKHTMARFSSKWMACSPLYPNQESPLDAAASFTLVRNSHDFTTRWVCGVRSKASLYGSKPPYCVTSMTTLSSYSGSVNVQRGLWGTSYTHNQYDRKKFYTDAMVAQTVVDDATSGNFACASRYWVVAQT